MKKRICINLFCCFIAIFPIVAQVFVFYIAPIFYGIYNFFTCQDIKDMAKMYSLSLASQLIGLSLAEILMYVVSFDYNDFAETPALLLINLILTLIIDSVFLVVKLSKTRLNKKNDA